MLSKEFLLVKNEEFQYIMNNMIVDNGIQLVDMIYLSKTL